MTVRNDFLFVAGARALDFLNTEAVMEGEHVDLLRSEDDVRAWLITSGLVARRDAGRLTGVLLRNIRELRTHWRQVAERLAGGGSLRPKELEPIAAVLARTSGRLGLQHAAGKTTVTFMPDALDASFVIAREIASFLSDAELRYVRRCEGDGCILFFHDTTKSHTRRWCSMSGCGNRAKAALFYRRRRQAGEKAN